MKIYAYLATTVTPMKYVTAPIAIVKRQSLIS